MSNNTQTASLPSDAQMDATARKDKRLSILGQIEAAHGLAASSLVSGVKMTVDFGPTSPAEVSQAFPSCNSASVYSSNSNTGAKCAAIIGAEKTHALIDAMAADGAGRTFPRVLETLRAIIAAADEAGVKALSAKAAGPVIRAAVKKANASAVAKVAKGKEEAAAKKADKAAGKVPAKVGAAPSQQGTTMARAMLEAGKGHKELAGSLLVMSAEAHKLPVREGREALEKEARAALAHACELYQKLAK